MTQRPTLYDRPLSAVALCALMLSISGPVFAAQASDRVSALIEAGKVDKAILVGERLMRSRKINDRDQWAVGSEVARARLIKVMVNPSVERLQLFRDVYSDFPSAQDAMEAEADLVLQQTPTDAEADVWLQLAQMYPDTELERVALHRLDELSWQAALADGTARGFAKYIEVVPDGLFADTAYNRMLEAAWNEAAVIDTVERWRQFEQDWPQHPRVVDAGRRILGLTPGTFIADENGDWQLWDSCTPVNGVLRVNRQTLSPEDVVSARLESRSLGFERVLADLLGLPDLRESEVTIDVTLDDEFADLAIDALPWGTWEDWRLVATESAGVDMEAACGDEPSWPELRTTGQLTQYLRTHEITDDSDIGILAASAREVLLRNPSASREQFAALAETDLPLLRDAAGLPDWTRSVLEPLLPQARTGLAQCRASSSEICDQHGRPVETGALRFQDEVQFHPTASVMAVYRESSRVTAVHDLARGEAVFRAPGTPRGWFGNQLVIRKGDEMVLWNLVTGVPERHRLPADLACAEDAPTHGDGDALLVMCDGGFALIGAQREALSVIRYAVPQVFDVGVKLVGSSKYIVTAERGDGSSWLGRMTVLVDFVSARASVVERSAPFLSYDRVPGSDLWVKHVDCGNGRRPVETSCDVRIGALNDDSADRTLDRRGTVVMTEHANRFVVVDNTGAWMYQTGDLATVGHVPGAFSSVDGSLHDEFRLVLQDGASGRRVNFTADGTAYDVGRAPRMLLHVATPDAMARLSGWTPEGR